MSALIKQIQVDIRDKSLIVTRAHGNALRLYFTNSKRNPRAPITELNRQLFARGPFPIHPLFNELSVIWFKKLFLKKDGTPRDTEQVRRLSAKQLEVVQNLTGFYFVGMMEEWDHTTNWEVQNKPGCERVPSYPVWRACANDGRWFDYYNIPWQNAMSGADTGVFMFPSEGGA